MGDKLAQVAERALNILQNMPIYHRLRERSPSENKEKTIQWLEDHQVQNGPATKMQNCLSGKHSRNLEV